MDIAMSKSGMVYAYRVGRRVMRGPMLYGVRFESRLVGLVEVYVN